MRQHTKRTTPDPHQPQPHPNSIPDPNASPESDANRNHTNSGAQPGCRDRTMPDRRAIDAEEQHDAQFEESLLDAGESNRGRPIVVALRAQALAILSLIETQRIPHVSNNFFYVYKIHSYIYMIYHSHIEMHFLWYHYIPFV